MSFYVSPLTGDGTFQDNLWDEVAFKRRAEKRVDVDRLLLG